MVVICLTDIKLSLSQQVYRTPLLSDALLIKYTNKYKLSLTTQDKKMKPTNVVMKLILSVGILFLIVPSLNAQDCKCSEVTAVVQDEPTSVLTVIGESAYPYFLNVRNLKKYSNIKYNGLALDFFNAKFYTLRSHGKTMKLYATYGEDGNLINGRYIRENESLPVAIYKNLATDNYKGWTMTSNKIVVHDFDALKTEYEVKLQQGNMKQTLFFDHSGTQIKKLSRT